MYDKILAWIATIILVFIVCFIGYNEYVQENVKFFVELKQGEDPFSALKQIVPYDSSIKEVKELDKKNNEYEITVSTKRKKSNLLEYLLKSHKVQNAELININPK
jgi:hypothetical protein